MAIKGPEAIDDALACEPQHSEGWQAGNFLISRGMRHSRRGRKLTGRRCGKEIEAQPSFGQIRPSRGTWSASLRQPGDTLAANCCFKAGGDGRGWHDLGQPDDTSPGLQVRLRLHSLGCHRFSARPSRRTFQTLARDAHWAIAASLLCRLAMPTHGRGGAPRLSGSRGTRTASRPCPQSHPGAGRAPSDARGQPTRCRRRR